MANESKVTIQDNFYRDSFGKILLLILSMMIVVALLILMFLYLYLNKPKPITFLAKAEWRISDPVPLDQPYLSPTDLLQWVSNALPKIWVYDFNHYDDQLKQAANYFTPDGWKLFLNQLNIYANYNNVQNGKLFVNGTPGGAPIILNQGLLGERYGWVVQMPIDINYAGPKQIPSTSLVLQILVIRVPTLNNLTGVAIDSITVVKTIENQL